MSMRIWKVALLVLGAAPLVGAAVWLAVVHAAQTTAPPGWCECPAATPWNEVGPGWVLVQDTPNGLTSGVVGTQLSLLRPGPQATGYEVLNALAESVASSRLVAWSPDGTRALFWNSTPTGPRVEQLALATGKTTVFALAGGAMPMGYAPPSGVDIVGFTPHAVELFGQSGALVRSFRIGPAPPSGTVLFSAAGTRLAIGSGHGLALVSSGGALRRLPIPGMGTGSCNPVRWWGGTTILAACEPPPGLRRCCRRDGTQLWLVPVSGARPSALTPYSGGAGAGGFTDAWQLPNGVYVNYQQEHGVGICRLTGGGCHAVTVPGPPGSPTTGVPAQVVTAAGAWLLVVVPRPGPGIGSGSLAWFDPVTGAEKWMIGVAADGSYNCTAIPYYTPASAPALSSTS